MTDGNPHIVLIARPGFEHRAELLSRQLNLPLCAESGELVEKATLALWLDEAGLSLKLTGPQAPGPVRCEFATGSARHRRLYGGGQGQAIAKAVGLNKGGFRPQVLDLSAGLGQDAFVLASLGASLTMVERHAIVHQLLADGLTRARANGEDNELQLVLRRMRLVKAAAADYLATLSEPQLPDIIYIDPMFPPRQKSASVKKEMAIFHRLVGADTDADQLLPLALDRARYRVVVKRPARAPALAGEKPGFALQGKSTRFDIYPLRKLPGS